MKNPWIFTGNTFDRATKTSNVKMLSIATDTDAKLQAQTNDPDIMVIYGDYHPVFVIYQQLCLSYDIAAGTRKGKTLNIVTLLKDGLKEQLPLWEGKVRSIYAEGTPEEVAFFPNSRTPFYEGTYETRIQAVGSLASNLAADPNPILTAYAPTVESYYIMLQAARNIQQQKEGLLDSLSTSRENQRKVVANALYSVLARLMVKYHADTAQINNFFDLSLIRNSDEIPSTSVIVKGKVTTGINTPVKGAIVGLQGDNPPPVTKKTNKNGRFYFRFDNVPPSEVGAVTMTIQAAGYQTYENTINVELGNVYSYEISLAQLMLRAA